MFKKILAVTAWFCAGSSIAADQPDYAPPPAWVRPIAIPKAAVATGGAAIQILLEDQQAQFGPDGDEFYNESAFRIVSSQGLSVVSAFTPSWDPQTETLVFNRFAIIRDGRTLDLLGGGKKVTVLRREKNLDLAMLDGDMTAVLQPEGLRVGDIVDVVTTLRRKDPIYKGRSEAMMVFGPATRINRLHLRAIWQPDKPIAWKALDGAPQPHVSVDGKQTELVMDAADYDPPRPPRDAPDRFGVIDRLQFSQFKSWTEVSALMAPLYDKAASLSPKSPLLVEADRIAATSADAKSRAAAALRLVQDQLRYAFVGLNLGGMKPAPADVTWGRRFGDCKGKTVVLLALLHRLGIEARPALVSTTQGDGLDQRLPMLGTFDHVIVRAEIAGKIYWLDGTREGDRALDDILIPPFVWALPLTTGGSELEPLTPRPLDDPAYEALVRIDASAGLDAPAPTHAEILLRGDGAVVEERTLENDADSQRTQREYWRAIYSWIDPKSVSFEFKDAQRILRLTMDGVATVDWSRNGDARDFAIVDSSLGFETSFSRQPGLNADAPFSVPFPIYRRWTTLVTLPHDGDGFRLLTGESGERGPRGTALRAQQRNRQGRRRDRGVGADHDVGDFGVRGPGRGNGAAPTFGL